MADPSWSYTFSKSKSREIENHYPTMSVDEICALPVDQISEKNCILFLWGTAPKLPQALIVMNAWGFEYVTNAVWNKKKLGMGYYWRGIHEHLLVGRRGKVSPPPPNVRIPSIFEEPRTRHSRKPDCARTMIENMYPDTTKIELFARAQSEGWDTWGNECINSIEFV